MKRYLGLELSCLSKMRHPQVGGRTPQGKDRGGSQSEGQKQEGKSASLGPASDRVLSTPTSPKAKNQGEDLEDVPETANALKQLKSETGSCGAVLSVKLLSSRQHGEAKPYGILRLLMSSPMIRRWDWQILRSRKRGP